MTGNRFLTPEDVVDRYRGGVSLGTLRNWRTRRIGPSFIRSSRILQAPSRSGAAANSQGNPPMCTL